jgi:signal transduction histidine kinase
LNLIIPIIFITIAIIQLGIFVNSISLIRIYPDEKAIRYWAASLLSSSIGITCIALGSAILQSLARGSLFLTFSNIIFFTSTIWLIFYSKSLKYKISNKDIKLYSIIVIAYGIGFEVVRQNGNFIDRQLFVASCSFLAYLVLLVEIKKQKLYKDSKYLKIFYATTFIEFILLLVRILILLNNDYGFIDSLNEIPVAPLAMLWLMLIVNIWSYIAINGYWTEKIASSSTANLIENTKIKILLSEKYKLINSLMTANKTAVSGALSASIAHELNQPLGAIKINGQHLDLLLKNKKEKTLIKNIIQDNDRAANIIATLKSAFTNNPIYQIIKFDTYIESLKPFFIQAASEKNISIKFSLNTSASVSINPDQIRQALSNLLQNSIEALSKTKKTNKLIQIKTFIKNNKLVCSISDNGPGVNKRIKNKVFELYESSKNGNMGLGLWLTKYIISNHKGTVGLNMKYQKGAEFSIELPISQHA